MRKFVAVIMATCVTSGAFAWWGPPPPPPCHYGYDGWAVAGVALGAGVLGAALYNAVQPRTVQVVQPTPVVVQQPVVIQQPAPVVVQQPAPVVVQQAAPVVPVAQTVWVEGHYIDQQQANGSVVRVWQPGHYEQRR